MKEYGGAVRFFKKTLRKTVHLSKCVGIMHIDSKRKGGRKFIVW
jgi:hypothetical protein